MSDMSSPSLGDQFRVYQTTDRKFSINLRAVRKLQRKATH